MVAKRKSNTLTNSDSEEEHLDIGISDDEEGGIRIGDIYVPPAPRPVCSNDPGAPRLVITHIVNTNFKSFAGSITLGPFHKCFTSIIGPNGNGKSNVIDAILFVFGYRASKIRSKKISVLIHSSEKFKDLQSCSVSIHFTRIIDKDNEDSFEEVQNTKLVISRTAFKDNSSYYEVNGKKVQFKFISKLLGEHGIDLHYNRFLILQGEVEQIAMMRPKAHNEHENGMLEYLEDIIGTSRFKEPIMKLIQNVEVLTQLRSEKLVRVKLATKECKELEGPMQAAVQFLKIENAITANKSLQFQKYIYDHEQLLKEMEEKKQLILQSVKKLSEEIKEININKKKSEKFLEEKKRKLNDLIKKKDSLTECFDKANKKDFGLQSEIVQTNNNRKKTKELLKAENLIIAELKNIPGKNNREIEILTKKVIDLDKKKKELEEEKKQLMAKMAEETKPLLEKREKLQTQLVILNETVGKEKYAYDLAESELQLYMKNEEEENAKLQKLHTTYEECIKTFKQKSEMMEELRKNIPKTENALKKAQNELNEIQIEENIVLSEMRSNRALLEEKRSSMQNAKSRGRVLDALMKYKQEGNIPGLLGRLGDLGAIDKNYDVAVSTACGALDHIVVDKVVTAKTCIDFLKRNNIGRATFIPLEKQEHLRKYTTSTIKTPENVNRLYDLIKVNDERVRTVFYYALRDTLVAENLEQATRIAYGTKRYRVVTLAGDLIEIAGTMSGGGKSVCRGRMGQCVALNTSFNADGSDNIGDMEQKVKELQEKAYALRERQVTLEQQIVQLKNELRRMTTELPKYSIEVESLSKQKPALEKQLKDQEKKAAATKSDPVKIAKFEKEVTQKKKLLEKANEEANVIKKKVDEVSQEINKKTGDKIKLMDKNLLEVTKNIEKFSTEVTRLTVQINTSERNLKKSINMVANMEQDIQNAEKRLLEMQAQRKEIEIDATQMINSIEKLTTEIEELEQEFKDIYDEIKEYATNENKLKSEKVEVDEKLTNVNKTIDEYKTSIHHWRKKLAELKLNEIPTESASESTVELKIYSEEELSKMNTKDVQYQLSVQQDKLQSCKPNLAVIQQYKIKQQELNKWLNDLDEVNDKRTKMKDLHDELIKKRNDDFMTGYQIINSKLKEMYQMLTLGGDAELELVDSMDPFSEGINFSVRPPKKSWKNISNLSGGEKTLSSLALVFALHYYKPSPLYIMDEIDAALDFKNVSIVGNYIKERTKNAQFIIISLRSNMFELADRLAGIYKVQNCTNTITINPKLYQPKVNIVSQPLQTVDQNIMNPNDD